MDKYLILALIASLALIAGITLANVSEMRKEMNEIYKTTWLIQMQTKALVAEMTNNYKER